MDFYRIAFKLSSGANYYVIRSCIYTRRPFITEIKCAYQNIIKSVGILRKNISVLGALTSEFIFVSIVKMVQNCSSVCGG
jgi:hypothetical protein